MSFFDVIRRYILFKGYKLKYVQNVTDIEDNHHAGNQRGHFHYRNWPRNSRPAILRIWPP